MDKACLKYEEEAGIGVLSISRPEVMNALNDQVISELNLFLDNIQGSKTARVLIITGEGKAFAGGADISKMKELNPEEAYIWSKTGQETFKRIMLLSLPVIAAVNGYALGGGLELAMSCDIRIASAEAKLGMPEVGLGLIPGYGGTKLLSCLVGPGNALYMILSGRLISAEEALRLRLVQKVVAEESLLQEAKIMATAICEKSGTAISSAKRIIREGVEMGFNDALDLEAKRFSEMFDLDAREGMAAFLEKRKPSWKR